MDQNATPQPVQVPPTTPEFLKPPTKKRSVLIIITAVIILAGVGGAAAYVYDLGRPDPKTIFTKALTSMKDVTAVEYAATFEGKGNSSSFSGLPAGNYNFTVASTGKVDATKTDDPSVDVGFSVDLHSTDNTTKVDVSFAMQAINLANKGYVLIKDLTFTQVPPPSDQMTAMIQSMIKSYVEKVKGKWLSFDTHSSSIKTDVNAEKQKVIDKLLAFDYLENIETLSNENVNGVDSYHYRVTVNSKKLEQIFEEAGKTSLAPVKNDYLAAVMAYAQANPAENVNLEVWIGKSDFRFYRINLLETTFTDDTTRSSAIIKGTLDLKNYNQSMNITAPTNSTPFEQIMQSSMAQSQTTSPKTLKTR